MEGLRGLGDGGSGGYLCGENAWTTSGRNLTAVGGYNGLYRSASYELIPEMKPDGSPFWVDMAPMSDGHGYHSSAVLMFDGRVLVAGGGWDYECCKNTAGCCPVDELPDNCDTCPCPQCDHPNAEIFSPPYLFDRWGFPWSDNDRSIFTTDGVPTATTLVGSYGKLLQVSYIGPEEATKAAMVRCGTVTHGIDPGQRYLELTFDHRFDVFDPINGERTTNVNIPTNAAELPPGVYMLFLSHQAEGALEDIWVPGKAAFVRVDHAFAFANIVDINGKEGVRHNPPIVGGGTGIEYLEQSENETYRRNGNSATTPRTAIECIGWTSGTLPQTITVDKVSIRVENKIKLVPIPDPPPPPPPAASLAVDLWRYHPVGGCSGDTCGSWMQVGAMGYTVLQDVESVVNIDVTASPGLYVKKIVSIGGGYYYRTKWRLRWNWLTGPEPTHWDAELDETSCRITYH